MTGNATPLSDGADITMGNDRHFKKECTRRWRIARALIEREDELVHQRMTSYLTIQGFLFAAFGALSAGWLMNTNHGTNSVAIGIAVDFTLCLFCVLAIGLAFHAKDTTDAAVMQLRRVVRWWQEYSGEQQPKHANDLIAGRRYPPIVGQLPGGIVVDRHILSLLIGWSVLLAGVVWIGLYLGLSAIPKIFPWAHCFCGSPAISNIVWWWRCGIVMTLVALAGPGYVALRAIDRWRNKEMLKEVSIVLTV
jgi:hypothetical protein